MPNDNNKDRQRIDLSTAPLSVMTGSWSVLLTASAEKMEEERKGVDEEVVLK